MTIEPPLDPDYVSEECIGIPVKRFRELCDAEDMLDALYAAGVDNWEGYENAMELLEHNELESECLEELED